MRLHAHRHSCQSQDRTATHNAEHARGNQAAQRHHYPEQSIDPRRKSRGFRQEHVEGIHEGRSARRKTMTSTARASAVRVPRPCSTRLIMRL